ncbi:MAG: MarR family transcriptional regulator [Firmicutes bacterium]|nr:MarR family transcriptional regulator [Bacillota bacterium]
MNQEMLNKLTTLKNEYSIIYNQHLLNNANDQESLQKSADLSFYQYQTMLTIYHCGPQTPNTISKRLSVTRSNATRIADALVKKKFCLRQKEPGKKSVYLVMSENGIKMIEEDRMKRSAKLIALYNEYIPQNEQDELLELYDRLKIIWSRIPFYLNV